MFFNKLIFNKLTRAPRIAHINGNAITVNRHETLLGAALRQGVAFPNSCRVGACGRCKCRLTEGRIKALTDASRTLSEQEIAHGFILACQSVPRSAIQVEVKLSQRSAASAVASGNTARLAESADTVRHNSAQKSPPASNNASIIEYLKYFMFHLVGLFSIVSILGGGIYITLGLLSVLCFYILGDALLGNDTSIPHYNYPGILTVQLWLALPLLGLIVFVALWSVSSGDPVGFGQLVARLSGIDLFAARTHTGWGGHLSTLIITGLMIGLIGTITGHELTHRTWDPVSLWIGRWLLAFSLDTSFSIEHVYGHHRFVATEKDPATAPRGRNVYLHIVLSTFRGNVSAWRIEASRLERRGQYRWSLHNVVLRGYLMSLALIVIAWWLGGALVALFFILCALFGKSLLEIVNYMEHYGIVRDPGTPVEPRHSWNTNRSISSWTMFNLTRHSHHHAHGEVPYHALVPYPQAPMMLSGYMTTILLTLIPPLWQSLMIPKLQDWDTNQASIEERELAMLANTRAGWTEFRAQPT